MISWALNSDPASVEKQKADWEAREAKKKADADRRAAERAQKKADEAAAAANAAKMAIAGA
jgi:hypothetical protein